MKTLELSVSEERSSNDVLSCRRDGISFAFKNKRGNGSVGVVVVQTSAFDLFELNHLRRIVPQTFPGTGVSGLNFFIDRSLRGGMQLRCTLQAGDTILNYLVREFQ